MRDIIKGVSPWIMILLAPIFIFFGWIGGIFGFIYTILFILGNYMGVLMDSSKEATQRRKDKIIEKENKSIQTIKEKQEKLVQEQKRKLEKYEEYL
ncbi:MAG: hypothetical protein WCO33_05210, partial [bacterium]